MKNKKFAAALMFLTAGSVFYGALPAKAGGVELEKIDVTFRRNHDDRYEKHVPPPPPHHYRDEGYRDYGRHDDFDRYERHFRPELPRHRGHLPPPPPPPPHHGHHGHHRHHGHGRGF